jgi:hypothetical protein
MLTRNGAASAAPVAATTFRRVKPLFFIVRSPPVVV